MRSLLRALLGGGALFLALGNLLTAGTTVFTLDSVTLTDGGTANGSFVWDNVTETLVSWSISTTVGTQQPTPYTYSNAIAGQGQIAIGNSGIYLLGVGGGPQLNLNFVGSLDSGSPLSFYFNNSREYNNYGPAFGRNVASGSVSVSQVPQFSQQGPKLVGTGAVGIAVQGDSVSLSADGNTAIVGGAGDNSQAGAAWVWTRSGGVWTQQGPKLVGSGAVGSAQQGGSVSLSADGNTAIVGGNRDNGFTGAAWVWTRSGGVWTQQGPKLVGSGVVGFAQQGYTVSLAADGNTAILGGSTIDNVNPEAAWLWARSGGVWTQQGSIRLGTVCDLSCASRGTSVSLSADGNTAIVGDPFDTHYVGAASVWTRSGGVWTQQGPKLVGSGAAAGAIQQGMSVSLSADGNTAIVGGPSDNSQAGAAWVWTRSGGVWTQQGIKLVGSGAAGTTSQAFSVSLSADGNTAIVGGPGDNNQAGATWVWMRSGGIWTQQGPKLVGSGAVGSALQGRSVALSADGNTAIVGGLDDNGYAGAAWVFAAGATQEPNWVLKSPSNSPTPRVTHAMAYDGTRGQIVLFGGLDGSNYRQNDTWVWDGASWTQKNPTNRPPPRAYPEMAYDSARGQVVLFGGLDPNGVTLNDTWVWDGTNWTQKSPANSPPPRIGHAMAYDSAREQVVLFGGYGTATLGDTWVWDGSNWTQKNPANSPSATYLHAMAYDSARGQVVLFGGAPDGGNNANTNRTWVWDGSNWTEKRPAHSPPTHVLPVIAYDSGRGQVVLFGGLDLYGRRLNDTWVWDGADWTQKNPTSSPTPREDHAMAYDSARGQVVLFGGDDGGIRNDTWVWGSPSPTGSISVTTNISAASFTVTGPATYSGSGTSFTTANAPAGTYTITYGAVNCYATPPSETKTLTAGGVLTFSAGAYQGRATINVSVIPAGAASATFSINPPVPGMRSNGPYPVLQNNVLPQPYTVTFNSATGFVPPSVAQTLSPSSSCLLNFSATYTTNPSQQPPTAVIDPIGGLSPNVPVTMNASNSHANTLGASLVQYRWDIQKPNGTDTLFGPQITYSWNSARTYLVTLTVTDTFGRIGSTNWVVTVSPLTPACTVSPLTPLATLVQQYPELYPGATFGLESNPIDTVHLKPNMQDARACFKVGIEGAGGTFKLTSAFRTDAYQAHLREVWDTWGKLQDLAGDAACSQIYAAVNTEFSYHGIVHRPAEVSNHTTGSAIDVCADGIARSSCAGSIPNSVLSASRTLNIADVCGLHQSPTDQVHFEHK